MNKSELIDLIQQKTQLQKKDCAAALDAALEAITEAVSAGDSVRLVGFGTFEVKERRERTGRTPRTREQVTIPASRAPVFKAGRQLKDAVNTN